MNINKKYFSNQKGITLLALVITVIVLIILASISLRKLNERNGVIKQATFAKDSARGSEVQETIDTEVVNNEHREFAGKDKKTREQVINELHQKRKLTDDEVEQLQETNTIKIGGVTVDFSELGTVSSPNTLLVTMFKKALEDNCTNADGSCTREDHLHIGDYVDYKNPTGGEYTVPENELGYEQAQKYLVSQNQLNWRVLGMEGTGDNEYIKLIAGSPMKQSKPDGSGTIEEGDGPYLFMRGAKAYINAVKQLNNICALYKTDLATKAESVNVKDIDKLTGIASDNEETYKTNIRKYNFDAYDINGNILKNYGDQYSLTDQYTPENPTTRTTIEGTINGYSYRINSSFEVCESVTMENNRVFKMLFDKTQSNERKYWLDSVGVLYDGSSENHFLVYGLMAVDGGR